MPISPRSTSSWLPPRAWAGGTCPTAAAYLLAGGTQVLISVTCSGRGYQSGDKFAFPTLVFRAILTDALSVKVIQTFSEDVPNQQIAPLNVKGRPS